MTEPLPVGLNIHDTDDFRIAAYSLFEADEVDVLEYSFDTGWLPGGAPEWLSELVDYYSSINCLLGHGVHFSPLSGRFEERQQAWLQNFTKELQRRRYRHVSEHFGFMTAGSFHDSAPLPVPRTEGAVRVGRARMRALAAAAGVPVGLENLGFAFGIQDVHEQGRFLDEVLSPVGGFLLLDLHNLYCQVCNFGVEAGELLDGYPLHRVRELHISGGSWSQAHGQTFRRDTHDGPVPEEVFKLLPLALARCPNVQAVVFEHMGGTLLNESDRERFRADYRRLRNAVRERPAAP